jgi:hypothetical protein
MAIPRLLDNHLAPWLARFLGVSRESADVYLWTAVLGLGALVWLVLKIMLWKERPLRHWLLATRERLVEKAARAKRSLTTWDGLRETLGAGLRKAGSCLGILAGLVLLSVAMYFHRVLLGLFLGLTAVLLARVAAVWTWGRIAAHRVFPAGSWAPKEWSAALRAASSKPREQSVLLARTDPQSLGLNPEDYLSLLVTIEPFVHKEPALSTYWGRRDQLEQVLRQERQG